MKPYETSIKCGDHVYVKWGDGWAKVEVVAIHWVPPTEHSECWLRVHVELPNQSILQLDLEDVRRSVA